MRAFAALLLLLVLPSAFAMCQSDVDCSLSGVCTDGVCTCDPGWVGVDCHSLNVTLVDPADGIDEWDEGASSSR
jgi:hypothetical protein